LSSAPHDVQVTGATLPSLTAWVRSIRLFACDRRSAGRDFRHKKENCRMSFRVTAIGIATGLFGLWLLLAPFQSARADTVADFYKGKTVELIIAYPPGSSRDAAGRLLIRHLSRHIPGHPGLVAKNMVGAGGLAGTNYMFNVASKEGIEIGLTGGTVPFGVLWSRDGVNFDATKFNWLGSLEAWVGGVFIRKGAPAQSLDELRVSEVRVGATGTGDVTAIYPRVLNALAGTKFNIVRGYRGTADLNLAIERGEIDGRVGWCYACAKQSKPRWLSESRVLILLQLAFTRDPELPDVPSLADVAKTEEARQIMTLVYGGQQMNIPLMLPPGVPPDRVAALRTAFDATMKDPAFLAEATKVGADVSPMAAADMERLIQSVYSRPRAVIERAAAIIKGN
jgi:tripartite-type tricarboxylate transporter receptor subunit TctC